MKRENYNGKKFNKLTILRDGEGLLEGKRKRRSVFCKCDCGQEKELLLINVTKGKIKSCGCLTGGRVSIKITPGEKFNDFTIIKELPYKEYSNTIIRYVEVMCDCGNTLKQPFTNIKSGKRKNCGCRKEIPIIVPLNLEELNKRDFGDWEVIEEISAKRNEKGHIVRTVKAQCKCGYIKETKLSNLIKRGKSCYGCFYKKRLLEASTPFNKIKQSLSPRFNNMKTRCYDKNFKDYKSYGAKGVTVCDEWLNSFDSFVEWSINNGFYIGCNLEIDRKENDKGYSPENCQYITKSENLLKMPCVNMTKEDVFFIRSEEFDISKIKEYGYKRNIVKNILSGRTFKDLV